MKDELDLHVRLLDELEEDVDVTHSKMQAAQKRLRHVLQNSGSCKCMTLAIALAIVLVVVVVLVFKLR